MRLPFIDAYKLIEKARDEDRRERLWQLYLVEAQNMTEENRMTFNDYCDAQSPKPIDNRSKESILSEYESIKAKVGG